MNPIFTFSLEQRAFFNIAITLWSQDDVRDLISQYELHVVCGYWQKIEKVVIQKSFKLWLPERLKENQISYILRVGMQLMSWISVHQCIVKMLPVTFVWTSLGTINNMRTAKLLLLGGTLDGYKSFALACMYCLVEEIKYYWNTFNLSLHRSKFKDLPIALYWFDYMCKLRIKDLLKPYSPLTYVSHMHSLKAAIESGNEVAMRFFFKVDLDMRNEEAIVISLAKFVAVNVHNIKSVVTLQRYSGIMMFLLSKMNAEQQTNVIVNYTYALLKYFLFFPLHSLFFEIIIKATWNSISKNEYSELLCVIVTSMNWEHNHHELFGEFWQQSPETYKQFVTDQGEIVFLFIGLSEVGDKKNFKLILKDILKMESKPIFACLISSKKWKSIEFLIKECLSYQNNLRTFRNIFKNHVHTLLSRKSFWKEDYSKVKFIKECQWDTLFQLVHSCVLEHNRKKRCTNYNNTSMARKKAHT